MAVTPRTPPPTPILHAGTRTTTTGMKRMEGKRPAPLLPSGLPASPGPKTPRTPRRSSLGPPLYPPPSSPLPPIPALPPTPTSPPRPSFPPPPPPARPSRSPPPPPPPVPTVRAGAEQEKSRTRSLSDVSLANTIDLSLHLDALIPFFREGHPSSSSPPPPPSSAPPQQQQRYNVLDPALSPSPSSVPALSYPSPRTSVSSYSSFASTSSRRHSFDAYSLLGGQWPLPPTPNSPNGGGDENADVLLLDPLSGQRTPLPCGAASYNSLSPDLPLHVAAAPPKTAFLHPHAATAISASLCSPSLPSLPLSPLPQPPPRPLPLPTPPRVPPSTLFSTMATQAQRKKHASGNGNGTGMGKGPGKRRASEAWIWII